MSDYFGNFSTTVNATDGAVTLELLSNLIPALLKVFLVVLVGYLFGRTNLYPKEAARNIAKLCSHLLLPVFVFNSMASISVTPESWDFLYAVLIAKLFVFVLILALVLITDRQRGRVGRAAISAVFCTQSNDFALGIPIFQVLYGTSNPGYRFLLYIVAPVNFMLLNPIAFVLMEFSRRRVAGRTAFSCGIIGQVLKQVLTSPLVIMTFAGVLLRLLLWEPASDLVWYSGYIEPVLDVISQAFTGCALFSLGLLIVGKFTLLKKNSATKPVLFILVKSLVLPITIKFVLDVLAPGNPSLSTAGFLYGIIPTAPGVFTYCLQYAMNADMVALSMVLGTLASAPLMLAMGSMVAIATDPSFDISTFAAAVPYFKMVPAVLSILGCLFFVARSCYVFKKLHRDMKIFRTLLLTAACMLLVCFISLFPCQITLGPYASNVSSEELYSGGAKFLFLVNYFSITFFRCLISALAFLSCVMLRHYVIHGCAPTERYQSIVLYAIHIVVSFVCLVCCVILYAITDMEEDSCVVPFSVTASAITVVLQLLLFAINVVCLIWFTKLRRQLVRSFGADFASSAGRAAFASAGGGAGALGSGDGANGPPVQRGRLRAFNNTDGSATRAVSMITFLNEDGSVDGSGGGSGGGAGAGTGGVSGGGSIRITTTAEEEYANQEETKMQTTTRTRTPTSAAAAAAAKERQQPTFSRNGDIVLGVDDDSEAGGAHKEPDAVLDFSTDYESDGLADFGPSAVLHDDGFDITSVATSIASGFEESEAGEDGKPDDEDATFHKSHPASRYLSTRGYTRRFGIIVYETSVGLLSIIALLLNVLDVEYTDSDTIIFAVTFVLSLLTYSSGIVLTIALGFQMCYKWKRVQKAGTNRSVNVRLDF